jgi:ankyrin repeat protein
MIFFEVGVLKRKGTLMRKNRYASFLVMCNLCLLSWVFTQKNLTIKQRNDLFNFYQAVDSGKCIFKKDWIEIINERFGGLMPVLHHAINLKNKEIVKKLLTCEADVNVYTEDPDGLYHQFNALHLAVAFGYLDIVTLLFKHSFFKIDINAPVGNGNKRGMASFTALHLAAYFQHITLVEFLLKKGAQVCIKTTESNKQYSGFKPSEVTNDEKIRDILVKKEKEKVGLL